MSIFLWTQSKGSEEHSGNKSGVFQASLKLWYVRSFPTVVLAIERPLYHNDKDHLHIK